MIARARDGQSLVDIALMVTGSAEGVWALALRNGLSVTGAIECGDEVQWESEDVEDARTVSRYEAEGIYPATEVSERVLANLLNEPIVKRKAAHEIIVADAVVPQSTRASVFTGEFTAAFS